MRYRARVRDLEARLAVVEEQARLNARENRITQDSLRAAFRAADMDFPDGPSDGRHLRLVSRPVEGR